MRQTARPPRCRARWTPKRAHATRSSAQQQTRGCVPDLMQFLLFADGSILVGKFGHCALRLCGVVRIVSHCRHQRTAANGVKLGFSFFWCSHAHRFRLMTPLTTWSEMRWTRSPLLLLTRQLTSPVRWTTSRPAWSHTCVPHVPLFFARKFSLRLLTRMQTTAEKDDVIAQGRVHHSTLLTNFRNNELVKLERDLSLEVRRHSMTLSC